MVEGNWIFKIVIGIVLGIAIKEWFEMTRHTKKFALHGIPGAALLCISFLAFVLIRTGFDQGIYYILVLLFGVWSSDSAAYFAGKFFGGAKMAPTISPNKTWAGFIGGMAGSVAMLIFANEAAPYLLSLVNFKLIPMTTMTYAFVIGVFFTIFGQLGDLAISAYKRKAGVKDTGTLIPGHGGVLDRIDSFLIVAPFFLITLMLLAP